MYIENSSQFVVAFPIYFFWLVFCFGHFTVVTFNLALLSASNISLLPVKMNVVYVCFQWIVYYMGLLACILQAKHVASIQINKAKQQQNLCHNTEWSNIFFFSFCCSCNLHTYSKAASRMVEIKAYHTFCVNICQARAIERTQVSSILSNQSRKWKFPMFWDRQRKKIRQWIETVHSLHKHVLSYIFGQIW